MSKSTVVVVTLMISLTALAGPPAAPAAKAPAAAPTAQALLARYDAVMSPPMSEADITMTAHRDDGTTRTYKMHVLKSGDDKLRSTFHEPTTAKGQEMLRNGDNMWLWMPNLKRTVRVASRDSFMGGDFNNADVLRPNYQADYDAVLAPSDDPSTHLIKLKAKNASVAYDAIDLFMSKDTQMPVRSRYFARSGKLLRSAEFSDVKDFGGGLVRPARLKMKNEVETARWSELHWEKVDIKREISNQRFVLDDLGR
jgi:outer membrane lipoprotein-sorting protein